MKKELLLEYNICVKMPLSTQQKHLIHNTDLKHKFIKALLDVFMLYKCGS